MSINTTKNQLNQVKRSYKKLSTHPQAFRDSRRALVDKIWNHSVPKWGSLSINGQKIKEAVATKTICRKKREIN